MAKTLEIKIEADSEEGIYPLLQHVFREITEGDSYNNPAHSNYLLEEGWLVLDQPALKGKYQWSRNT